MSMSDIPSDIQTLFTDSFPTIPIHNIPLMFSARTVTCYLFTL